VGGLSQVRDKNALRAKPLDINEQY
jgi:hypothetical protein